MSLTLKWASIIEISTRKLDFHPKFQPCSFPFMFGDFISSDSFMLCYLLLLLRAMHFLFSSIEWFQCRSMAYIWDQFITKQEKHLWDPCLQSWCLCCSECPSSPRYIRQKENTQNNKMGFMKAWKERNVMSFLVLSKSLYFWENLGIENISPVYNRQCSWLKLIQAELFKGQCIIYKPFNLSFKTIFHVSELSRRYQFRSTSFIN